MSNLEFPSIVAICAAPPRVGHSLLQAAWGFCTEVPATLDFPKQAREILGILGEKDVGLDDRYGLQKLGGSQRSRSLISCDNALFPCRQIAAARLHKSHEAARQFADAMRLAQLDRFPWN